MIRAFFSLLFISVAATISAAVPGERIATRIIGVQDGPTTQTLKQRLLEGKNIQVMLLLPDARERGGALLEPASVSVKWGGASLRSYVYYRMPSLVLVFAIIDAEELTQHPAGELRISGSFVKSASEDVSENIAMSFSPAEIEQLRGAQSSLSGRSVRIIDSAGGPVGGAFVFGQRRGDLFFQTDDQGIALFDVPARNSSPSHYAWKEGFWAERFDPLTSGTVTLAPSTSLVADHITARLVAPDGSAVRDALAIVNYVDYTWWELGGLQVTHPPGRDVQLTILSAGFAPRPIMLSEALGAEEIVLKFRDRDTP